MSNIAEYTPFTPEAYKQGRQAARGKQVFIRKLPPGQHRFRFLPAKSGEVSPFIEIHQHWVDTPKGRRPINCPQRMANQPCPLCIQIARMKNSEDSALIEQADKMEVNSNIYVNVIDRSCPEEGVKVLQLRPSVLAEILDVYDMSGKPDFMNPGPAGRDVIINRTGTSRTDTRYKAIFAEPSPAADSVEQINQWLADMKPLSKTYAKVLTPPQMVSLIQTGELPKRTALTDFGAPQIGATAGQDPTAVSAPDLADGDFSDGGDAGNF